MKTMDKIDEGTDGWRSGGLEEQTNQATERLTHYSLTPAWRLSIPFFTQFLQGWQGEPANQQELLHI